MEPLAKLLSALASLAWPAIFAVLMFVFFEPLKKLIESARGRKFTIKVAGNELTMEEASEIQRQIVSDIQSKLAELEKRLATSTPEALVLESTPSRSSKRILWVDDRPKNNSFLVASLEERGAKVDVALSTKEGIEKFKALPYDIVLSDMGRPEGEKAGIDLAKRIRELNPRVPVFIFCGGWAARNLREEALAAGVREITSSGTTLLSQLPLANGS
jgi:CheY-like chemotaxis protein